MGHADALDGPVVRPLADARRRPRRDAAGRPRPRHLRRAGVAGHRPVPDGGCRPAWPAADPRVERLPGAQRPDLRDPPRPSGRVVPQPGCGQLADGRSGRGGGSTCRTSTRRCRSRRTRTGGSSTARHETTTACHPRPSRLGTGRPARHNRWSRGASRHGRPRAGGSSRWRRTDRSAVRRSAMRRGPSSRPRPSSTSPVWRPPTDWCCRPRRHTCATRTASTSGRGGPARAGQLRFAHRVGSPTHERPGMRDHVSVRPPGGRPGT